MVKCDVCGKDSFSFTYDGLDGVRCDQCMPLEDDGDADTYEPPPHPTLSRREIFAIEILKAYASRSKYVINIGSHKHNADMAVQSADALIARLDKNK